MRYYVYTLADPRDGAVFYVGKGSGNRIDAHEGEARSGVKSPKCERIRAIERDGKRVVKAKVKHFSDEREAYRFEALLIAARRDSLTNQSRGGFGGVSSVMEKYAGNADLLMLVLALLSKIHRPRTAFASALHKVISGKADEWIARLWLKVDQQELAREMRRRGVNLTVVEHGPAL